MCSTVVVWAGGALEHALVTWEGRACVAEGAGLRLVVLKVNWGGRVLEHAPACGAPMIAEYGRGGAEALKLVHGA